MADLKRIFDLLVDIVLSILDRISFLGALTAIKDKTIANASELVWLLSLLQEIHISLPIMKLQH